MSIIALQIPPGKPANICDSIKSALETLDTQCDCQHVHSDSRGMILAITLSDTVLRREAQKQNLSLLEKSGTSLPYRDEYKSLFATFPSGTIFSPSEQLLLSAKALEGALLPPGTGPARTVGEFLSSHGVRLVPVHDAAELAALRREWGVAQVLPGSPTGAGGPATPASVLAPLRAAGVRAVGRAHETLGALRQKPWSRMQAGAHQMVQLFKWLAFSEQPLDNIRDYFGENVAFYFAFGQTYSRWLLAPAIFGVLVWLCQQPTTASNQARDHARANALLTSAFALFLSVWSTLFLKHWRRAQSELAYTWCVLGQTSIEQPRPQFKPDYVLAHPVTGVAEPQEKTSKHMARFFTFTVPSMSILLFGGLLSLLWAEQFRHVLKRAVDEVLAAGPASATPHTLASAGSHSVAVADQLQDVLAYMGAHNGSTGSWLAGLLPAASKQLHPLVLAAPAIIRPYLPLLHTVLVQVITAVLMAVGRSVAAWSTERENHKLASAASASMTAKLVLISSVLTFVPLLYIAFVEQDLVLLGQRLLFALVWGAVISTVMETGIPLLQRTRAGQGPARGTVQAGDALPIVHFAAIKEASLATYDPYDDMLELFTQYGLLSLFAPVFPLAPLLAYLNNLQEARADAIKICALQRPRPEKVSGLGAWNSAFELMGYASVLTQAGLIGVATSQADWPAGLPAIARAVMVILVEHLIIALKVIVDAQVADVPESVTLRVMREQMLRPQIVWAAMRATSAATTGGARRQSVTQGTPTGRTRRMVPSETTYSSGPAPASAGHDASGTRNIKGFWADGQGQDTGEGAHMSTASGTLLEPMLHAQSRMASLAGLGESGLGVAAGSLPSEAMAMTDHHIMHEEEARKDRVRAVGAGAEIRKRAQAPGSSSGETSIVSRW